MTISVKLKLIKQIAGLTQESLASKIGVSFVTLNSWINNKSTPHKDKQTIIDNLYKKYTGQKIIPLQELQGKKEFILSKSKKYKNIINTIAKRKDLYDQFILSLTYNSNNIEGSTLTEHETADVIFRNLNIKNKSLIENLEAKNHQAALEYLFKTVNRNFVISKDFILKLHSKLMNGIRDDAGLYRRHGVRIVGANVPTANYLKISKSMDKVIDEINSKNKDIIGHTSLIHSKFEKIHPFSDGNGRIGRLIIVAMLIQKNLPPAIIKQEDKNLYYKYLQISQTSNDSSLLESFICDCIFSGFKIIEQ